MKKILTHLPSSARKALIKTTVGRNILWSLAQAGVKSKVGIKALVGHWGLIEYARLGLFFIWWPGTSFNRFILEEDFED